MKTLFLLAAMAATAALSMAQQKQIIKVGDVEYQTTRQHPATITNADGTLMLDFARDAFGQIELQLTSDLPADTLVLHLGECIRDGHVDRNPGGTRRYRSIHLPLEQGTHTYRPAIAKDGRNTRHPAVLMPQEVGEVTPFRYVEIEGYRQPLQTDAVTRIMVTCPYDDEASSFHCDNEALNQVWDLCRYSILATSFTGYYVDGDRERISYEADALINQLCHYGVDARYDVARRTFERLIEYPTWPTEWILQMDLMAWYDYLYTGNTDLIRRYLPDLRAHTLLALRDSKTGLVTSARGQSREFLQSIHRRDKISDIVDWPHSGILGLAAGQGGEDDGYVYKEYNTVVNAYHYMAVKVLAEMYGAIGQEAECRLLRYNSERFRDLFNQSFFDAVRGVYVDGLDTDHASLHANMFAMAFGLVPDEHKASVAAFIKSRGMACSVYGAQFLLDALYECGEADYALQLMTTDDKRGWLNMLREGSTITMEAWGNEFKPNQDWNHAWGAAPANIIPMRLMGVRPLEPGFTKVLIAPQLGSLNEAEALIPTPLGSIYVKAWKDSKGQLQVKTKLPKGIKAEIRK